MLQFSTARQEAIKCISQENDVDDDRKGGGGYRPGTQEKLFGRNQNSNNKILFSIRGHLWQRKLGSHSIEINWAP